MVEEALGGDVDRLVQELARAARAASCLVATAESLTGGQLAAAIAAAPEASAWYRGGIVAYQPEVKYSLLQAPIGPVVTAPTAVAMACSAAELCRADYAVAVTGVGGPDAEEGQPPGTVFLATSESGGHPIVEQHLFEGAPVEVMRQTIESALRALLARVRGRGE